MEQEVTDAELVRTIAARGADARSAEEALCRRYAPRIRLYGLRHLRDEDRARDLVQMSLLAVLEAARAARIAELDKIERFVLATARNIAVRVRQRDARAQPMPVDDLEVLAGVVPEAPPVEREGLMRCFDQLEDRARSVVFLTFNEERSADEIAAALGTTAGNVRVVRHRAIAAIRKCLDGAAREVRA